MATFQRMINENLAPKQKKEPEEAPSAAEVIVPHEHKEVRARYKSYRFVAKIDATKSGLIDE